MPPKVSVVLPTYQRANVLGEALGKILAQTLQDIDVIVCDDGSSDTTADVVREVADPRVRYLRRDHLGIPRILNEGMQAAGARYIMFCHDHDIYDPRLLEELSGLLDRYPSAAFAHCAVSAVDPSGQQELARYVHDFPELTPGADFLERQLLPGLHCCVCALNMVRTSALRGEGYDPKFAEAADLELWLRLSTRGDVAYSPRLLIKLRQRDATSVVIDKGLYILAKSFEAKKVYLSRVESSSVRRHLESGWRRSATLTAVGEFLLMIAHGRKADTAMILEFLHEHGEQWGIRLIRAMSHLPTEPMRMSILSARSLRRFVRALRSAVARTQSAPA